MSTIMNRDKILLRLPEGWRAALKIAAARNGRSISSEIVQRLKTSVESDIEREIATTSATPTNP